MKLNKYLTVGVIVVAFAAIIILSQPLRENMAGATDIEYVAEADDGHCVMITGGKGTKITAITFAGYGTSTIDANGVVTKGSCNSSIIGTLEARCLGKERCTVRGNEFGDPCGGVRKTVLVKYKATKPSSNTASTDDMEVTEQFGEDSGFFSMCASGRKTATLKDIKFASWGTPSIGADGVPKTGWCHANHRDNFINQCVGKKSCGFWPDWGNLGDPCRGHRKNVVVTYVMGPPATAVDKVALDKAAADKAAADKAAADKAAKDAADKAAADKAAADKAAKDAADKAAKDAADKAAAEKAAKDAADKAEAEKAAIAANTKLSEDQKAAALKAAEEKAAADKAAAALKAGIAADTKLTADEKAAAIKAIDEKAAADKAAADKAAAEKTAVFIDKIFGIEFKDENQANMAYAGGGIALLLIVGGIFMFAFSSPAPPAYGARRRRK